MSKSGKSGKRRPKKPRRHLTPRQRALVQNLAKGSMTLGQAAIASGYTTKYPAQSAYQALQQMRGRISSIMDELGLTERALIEKYLKPLLVAKQTKYFQHNGHVRSRRIIADNETRRQSLDMAFRLRGSYASRDDDGSAGPPKIMILDLPRPERPALPVESTVAHD